MNCTPTYFPTADGKEIHKLRWTNEGKIQPDVYVLQETTQKAVTMVPNNEALDQIMRRLDEMQKDIKRLSRHRNRPDEPKSNQKGGNES